MKKRYLSILLVGVVAMVVVFLSKCSTDSIDVINPEDVIERVDVQVTGDTKMEVYEQSIQSDRSNDLVDFNYDIPKSNEINFVVKLLSENYLYIKMYNRTQMTPESQIGVPYNMYKEQELNDKSAYVVMDVRNDQDPLAKSYSSNIENNEGVQINVFSITGYDLFRNEILCRIDAAILHDVNTTGNSIDISGSFKGSILDQYQ